jgi:hypothetical protein
MPKIHLFPSPYPEPQPPSDWPPLDIFHYAFIDETPRIGLEVFPATVATFAQDVSERLAVEAEAIAVMALVALAGAAHDAYAIQPTNDADWREHPRLWGAMVAESGLNKSPVLAAIIKPHQQIDQAWQTENAREIARYGRNHGIWKRAHEIWERKAAEEKVKKENKAGKAPEEPTKPAERQLIVEDTTVEALIDIIHDNPRSPIIVCDELTALFGSFDAYRENKTGKDRAAYLRLFNGGPYSYRRVKRGRISVPNWAASIIGMIPPDPMRQITSKLSTDGLLQRFLAIRALGTGTAKADRSADAAALAGYHNLVRTLSTMQPDQTRAKDINPILLSKEAHRCRRYLTDQIEAMLWLPAVKADPSYAAHLNKLPGIFARVLLLCHIIEEVTRGARQPGPEVAPDLAERICRLFLNYLIPHAQWFYRHIVAPKAATTDLVNFIAGTILTKSMATVSCRDIYKAKHSTTEMLPEIKTAMLSLGAFNWLRPHEAEDPWHPTRWTVNPLVHDRFKDAAEKERQRRQEGADRMQAAGLTLGIKTPAENENP